MKKVIALITIIAVLYAVLPLFGKNYIPTHDGEYHIIRFWQFAKMLSSGYVFPRWAPDLNSGYGIPLFMFHYPFPNYIGALFHLFGISFVDSFKLELAFGYLMAVFACFLWLSRLFRLFAAFVGTVIFSVIPYWFVDIYVRGSVGEVWAIAWFFVALVALERKSFLFTWRRSFQTRSTSYSSNSGRATSIGSGRRPKSRERSEKREEFCISARVCFCIDRISASAVENTV